MGTLRQDLRFAWRQLIRAPAFTATAVITLAIGIGANTGIFSILNGFLRPLPVPQPERIVVIAAEYPGDETGVRYRFSYPALQDYRAQTNVFAALFAFDTRIGGLTTGTDTTQFLYHYVTGNFFTGLGLKPAAGRLFEPGEGEQLGAEPVVVLGHAFWLKRFGGSRDVLGTLVRIDGKAVRIVGVAPQGFRGLFAGADVDGYVPLVNLRTAQQAERLFNDRSYLYLTMAGRLKPGIAMPAAQAALDTMARRLSTQYPATESVGARAIPEPRARPMPLRFFSTILPVIENLLLVLAVLVLLLACLNVTNLLFVRASARSREMAVRSALGSGRARLIRMLLTESLLLAALGVVAGLFAGQWSAAVLLRSFHLSTDLSITVDSHFDWRVFWYAVGTAVFSGVAIGIIPAFRASRVDLGDVLHDGDRSGTVGSGRQRARSALVVAQIVGSMVLLVVAGLFVQSLRRAERLDLGFDPNHVLTFRLNPGQIGYDLPRTTTFYDELERRLRALPGVERVAFSALVPMTFAFNACSIDKENAPVADERGRPAVSYNLVGTDYFETLRLPLVRGRAFGDHDTMTTSRVAIVNETLAVRLWPGEDPIGKRLNVFCAASGAPWEVVGVARDSKYVAVFEKPLPYLYLPLAQTQPLARMVQIRSALAPAELAARVTRQVETLDANLHIAEMRTMNEALAGGLGYVLFRFGATQAAAMGALGLLLAVVGLYGVVSYSASQRVREIGIRLALGATASDVRRLVIGQGTRLVLTGVIVGAVVSLGVSSMLRRFVVLVDASDPITSAMVTLALVCIALVACYLPARRATRVDPMTALRHE